MRFFVHSALAIGFGFAGAMGGVGAAGGVKGGSARAGDHGRADDGGGNARAVAPKISDAAAAWLHRIEARADRIDTLRAKVTYVRVQGLLGDKQARFGKLVYDAGNRKTPPRFAVHFDRVALNGQMQRQDRSYIFDGRWLAEKHQDEKVFIRRQLVARDQPAKDLLSMGEGPFVLPLNLKASKIRKRFHVALVPSPPHHHVRAGATRKKGAAAGGSAKPTRERANNARRPQSSGRRPAKGGAPPRVHLRLTPRRGVDIDQKRIDLWFDRRTLLPVRARSLDQDQSSSDLYLRDPQVNVKVDPRAFDTSAPHGGGWQVEVKRLDRDGSRELPGKRERSR